MRRSSYSAGTERRERIFSYMSGCVNAGSSSSLCPLYRRPVINARRPTSYRQNGLTSGGR